MSDLSLAIFHVLLRYHGRLPEHEIDNESLQDILGPSLMPSRYNPARNDTLPA